MKAIPQNFRDCFIGERAHDDITSFNIDSAEIKCEDNVTPLGKNIDFSCDLMAMCPKLVKELQNNSQS